MEKPISKIVIIQKNLIVVSYQQGFNDVVKKASSARTHVGQLFDLCALRTFKILIIIGRGICTICFRVEITSISNSRSLALMFDEMNICLYN